jgi:glycosyltransferase involved in cell wall biosynthesis
MSAAERAPVTAVIAAYNREHTVARAIRSIQAQRHAVAEVIVVDDASQDGTAAAARAAGATVLTLQANGGAAAARNHGIQAATQPWIAFLDSDDEWLPGHIETLWPHADRYGLITGASQVVDDDTGQTTVNGVRRRRELVTPLPLVYPDNFVSSGGVLVSRAALTAAGGFDETLRFSEDFDLWLRVLSAHRGLALADPVCVYHRHGGQKTSSATEARAAQRALLERYRDQPWWSETAYARRVALNECERSALEGSRAAAVRLLARGVLRRPSIWVPVALEMVHRRRGRT